MKCPDFILINQYLLKNPITKFIYLFINIFVSYKDNIRVRIAQNYSMKWIYIR